MCFSQEVEHDSPTSLRVSHQERSHVWSESPALPSEQSPAEVHTQGAGCAPPPAGAAPPLTEAVPTQTEAWANSRN